MVFCALLQTGLKTALSQHRAEPYGKEPNSDLSFKLFIRKNIYVEGLRGNLKQDIRVSKARCAPESVSPPSLQMARGVKSWCPSGQHTFAWGGIGQLSF